MKAIQDTRLLIVDDDEELRDAVASSFRRQGFQILVASDGKEAFELLKTEKVDGVLTDIRMPNWDGIRLLSEIKEHHPDLPAVILFTGYADIEVEEAYDLGADAVVQKPFDTRLLRATIMRALTPPDERWSQQIEKFHAELKIELKFSEFGTAVSARLLDIGRGGMLVALPKELPKISQNVFFSVEFSQCQPLLIEGSGIVRWVRLVMAGKSGNHCGIEFLHLSDRSRDQVLELISKLKTKAFIPSNRFQNSNTAVA